MPHPLPPKKEVALALLERSSVHVHLDPRAAGVVVPPWLKRQPQLVLQIGLNMPVPIPDLRLDEGGMTCTLSFNRSPFYCVIPWTSVFAMVGDDGRGMVWQDDVPPEVAKPSQARPDRPTATTPLPTRAPSKEAAREAAEASASEPAEKTEKAAGKKTKRAPSKKKGANGKAAPEREASPDSRGNLVAVPNAAARARDRGTVEGDAQGTGRDLRSDGDGAARPAPAPAPMPAAAPARRPVTPSPSSPGANRPTTQSKPKRELPPYLRVVK